METVLLGPQSMLHNGIHGALTEMPPPGIAYSVRPAIHVVALAPGARGLFDDLAMVECVDFGPGREFVQSAYWPVIGRSAWAVESGDFAYALFCGHYGVSEAFRTRQARRGTRTPEFEAAIGVRARRMLQAYAHTSCKAVLTYTQFEAANVRAWAARYATPAGRDQIMAKLHVCSPAVRPEAQDAVEQKWERSRMRVVFCGRWFESKRGLLALRVIEACLGQCAADYTYIGPIPHDVKEEYASVLSRITYYPSLRRSEVKAQMREAHILLHPSRYESVGMALLEAAACGMAIVTPSGAGLEHLGEWFGDAGTLWIDDTPDELGAYVSSITSLASDHGLAYRHGMRNYVATRDGHLSVDHRDRVLRSFLEPTGSGGEPLSVECLLDGVQHDVLRLPCAESMRQRAAYVASQGLLGERLGIPVEL